MKQKYVVPPLVKSSKQKQLEVGGFAFLQRFFAAVSIVLIYTYMQRHYCTESTLQERHAIL